jgi:protein-L-isoaspartate(D-aspartate) O-methyltransferase
MTSLHVLKQFYAAEVAVAANLKTSSLIAAFSQVPREDFLGPGRWRIAVSDPTRPGAMTYVMTRDADPRHLYHDVAIAIDPSRELNNGHPSSLASWLDALDLRAGDVFVHVGCSVGYYTAIAAQAVGTTGRVFAVEIDAELAQKAKVNLRKESQVTVAEGDGAALVIPQFDAPR